MDRETAIKIIEELDEYARELDPDLWGLPNFVSTYENEMVEIILELAKEV